MSGRKDSNCMQHKDNKKLEDYLSIWWQLTLGTSQIAFESRFGALIFMLGKVLRFLFFLFFLYLLTSRTRAIVGYTFWQILFFYATFNFLDAFPQFVLRNVYRF